MRLLPALVLFCALLPGHSLATDSGSLAGAPRFKVHPLYLEEETGSDTVRATLRDRDGFLWLATDNGLKRYDGYHYRIYSSEHEQGRSLGSTSLTALLEDRAGHLWAVGSNLSRYSPTTEDFSRFDASDGELIRAAVLDRQGAIWLGGDGFGLRRFDPERGRITAVYFENEPLGTIVAMTYSAAEDALWVVSKAGLYRFNIESSSRDDIPVPLPMSDMFNGSRAVLRDSRGQLWLGTNEGLVVFDPASGEWRHHEADGDTSLGVVSLFEDSRGRIWMGTDKRGVRVLLPDSTHSIAVPASASPRFTFPLSAITHIQEDSYGNLWFAAGPFGAYRINDRSEKFGVLQHDPNQPDSLAFDNVLDFLEQPDGSLYVATDGRGLEKFDPATHRFSHYRHDPNDPNSLSSDSVVTLTRDQGGIIWVGTWQGGLNRFNPATGTFSHIKHDHEAAPGTTLAANHIFDIVVDAQGRLLLSVWQHGLQIYNPADGSFETYLPRGLGARSGINNNTISVILPTEGGRFWIGGYAGLELFDPAARRFTTVEKLRQDQILDAYEDRLGILWLATTRGLVRYSPNTDRLKIFTKADGLSDNFVASIDMDELGRLWLGTRRGLTLFDPGNNEFTTFRESDGLAGLQFNRQSHLKSRSGQFYFGGSQGITLFNPIRMPRNEFAPQVHLIELDLFRRQNESMVDGLLPRAVNAYPKIDLQYHQRDLGLEFAALSFQSPASNRYKYRLLGLEDDWNEVDSSRRRVRYSNLLPGRYEFQVLGSNNEGVWSARPKTLAIVVHPAWWQTGWARLLFSLLTCGTVYGTFRWKMRANRRRQLELERLVEDKTAALQQANRSFQLLNAELEQRVAHRTEELSNEIEERKNSEARSYQLAYHDSLTGLKNREWLLDFIRHNLVECDRGGHFTLFYIGGDRFKQINDIYSQSVGDQLLCAVAAKLTALLPAGSQAVRLGGDEFALISLEQWPESAAVKFAEAIIAAFKQPLELNSISVRFSVSLGILSGGKPYQDPTQILRDANIALRRAKDRGRGSYQLFDQEMLARTLEQAALEQDLRAALAQNQFHLVMQPIIDIGTGAVQHFEALLRWQHPARGFVPPDRFIPLAESIGLIGEIGLWVLERACIQLNDWQAQLGGAQVPPIAVNLSPLQLAQLDFLARLDEIFAHTGVDPSQIKFEITESALMEHTDTIDVILEALRSRGIELAIDDFGTGYSSLSYLDKLPVQVIKIDRSFVWALTDGSSASAHEIVRATISLAHNLKMQVVAEGIETEGQMAILAECGCDFGQGYHIAKPLLPADALAFLLRSRQPPDAALG